MHQFNAQVIMTAFVSLEKAKKYDITTDPYLKYEQNQRIQSAASHALITTAALLTAAFTITACVTSLSLTAMGVFTSSIIVSFVAGVFFLPDTADFMPAYQPLAFDEQDRYSPSRFSGDPSPTSIAGRSTAVDPHMAKADEIALFPKGIPNPSCNCFMNAALQTLMFDEDISAHILRQLETLAADDDLANHNPLIPAEPTISVPNVAGLSSQEFAAFQADLLSKQDALVAVLYANPQIAELQRSLDSYKEEDLLPHVGKTEFLAKLYLTLSTKNAAQISMNLLTKWKSGYLISSSESKLLRVTLTKLLGRDADIALVKSGTKEEAKWRIPGLNTSDYSIYSFRQDEAGNFARKLIENLDNLTASENPLNLDYTRISQGYRLPDAEHTFFDDALKIEAAKKTSEYKQLGLTVTRNAQNRFQLDHQDIFSEFRTYRKEASSLEKAYECLPGTQVGQTISEIHTYSLEMPEKLFLHVQASFDTIHKFEYVRLQFTDPQNLTITYPENEAKEGTQTYKLKSFTVHTGQSVNSGHYYAYSRFTREDGTDYWIKQNDSSVTAVSVHEVKHVLSGNSRYVSANMLILDRVHA